MKPPRNKLSRFLREWKLPVGTKASGIVTVSPVLQQYLRLFDGTSASYGVIYRELQPVRTVVDFLADAISTTPLKVYQRAESGRPEVRDHPLAALLRHPNDEMSTRRLIEETVKDLALYGNAYWRKMEQGRIRWVVPLPPHRITPQEGNVLAPDWYDFWDGTNVQPVKIGRHEMVHFKLYDPEDRRIGSSKLESLRSILAEEVEASKNRAGFWKNVPRTGGIIERPHDAPAWDDDAIERFRTMWKNRFTGDAQSGSTPILEDGMKWVSEHFSPKDAEFVAGRVFVLEATVRVFNIPLSLFGIKETMTFASAQEFAKQLYRDSLPTWYELIQEGIEVQLRPWFRDSDDIYTEFEVEAKLRGDFKDQIDFLSKALGGGANPGFMTLREVRRFFNLPDLNDPRLDGLIIPMNVLLEAPGSEPTSVDRAAYTLVGKQDEFDPARPHDKPFEPAKVPTSVLRRRDDQARELEKMLVDFFSRQERTVKSRWGAGLKDFDTSRWNGELTELLWSTSRVISSGAGRRTVAEIGGAYDVARTDAYTLETSRIRAEGINALTAQLLEQGQLPDQVFSTAKSKRAGSIALTVATGMNAFGRSEAGRQNGMRSKTWLVTSPRSRHPHMNGETVPIDQVFSNGGRWPGDSELTAEEAANCQCVLSIGN